jgi:uncharacterized Zn finger protein
MCKHVAAVLYGIGARLDLQPELLFSLRRVDANDLVAQAGAGLPKAKKGPASGKVLDDSALADVFGIEMAAIAAPTSPAARRNTATATKAKTNKDVKAPTKPASVRTVKKPAASKPETAKKVALKKPVKAKPPAKASTGSRTSTDKIAIMKTKIKAASKAPKPKAAKITKHAKDK